MWTRLLLAAVLTGAVYGQTGAPSRDYTQWRGPDREGSVNGFVEPATWPAHLTRK